MIKPELIQAISDKTRLPKKQIEQIIDCMLDVIAEEIRDGEKVLITGFGTFYLGYRKSRRGINPVTRQYIKINGMPMPKFKAGQRLKRIVRDQL